MKNQTEMQGLLTLLIRWIARIWSIASIGLVLLFIVGEGNNPANLIDWLGFLFFPLGICFGMVFAWWREGVGGGITIGSLLVFYLIRFVTASSFPKGWAWLAFAFPGFLFLLCWYRSRKLGMSAA
ncbi:MAG: hypothetical protein ABSD46_12110 [Bacteroidota bacterium]